MDRRTQTNKPRVSICIPAYKLGESVRRLLISIYNQDFQDFEVIITDDSPDDTVKREIADFLLNGNLRYIHNQIPLGPPDNWNFAISHACGQYIKIMHHDDFFASSHALSAFVDQLEKDPSVNLVFSDCYVINEQQEITRYFSINFSELDKARKDPRHFFWKNFVGSPSVTMVRSSAVQDFDTNLKWLVDLDWYIRLSTTGRLAHIQEPLILVSSGLPSQVTATCSGNPSIECYEHVYLAKKIFHKPASLGLIRHFAILFSRCDMSTIKDIKVASGLQCLPTYCIVGLYLSKLILAIKRLRASLLAKYRPAR